MISHLSFAFSDDLLYYLVGLEGSFIICIGVKAVYDKSFGNQPVNLEKTLYSQDEPISGEAKRILNSIANVGWTSGGHSAGYVPVYAIGANAELFQGRMDNTEIPAKIAEAAGYQH